MQMTHGALPVLGCPSQHVVEAAVVVMEPEHLLLVLLLPQVLLLQLVRSRLLQGSSCSSCLLAGGKLAAAAVPMGAAERCQVVKNAAFVAL